MSDGPQLYLAHIDPPAAPEAAAQAGLQPLAPGLYLIATAQTRSQCCHALKRCFMPERLLVAPLAAAPKFKGMPPGTQAWLRRNTGR